MKLTEITLQSGGRGTSHPQQMQRQLMMIVKICWPLILSKCTKIVSRHQEKLRQHAH